jgi:hypothetical protein
MHAAHRKEFVDLRLLVSTEGLGEQVPEAEALDPLKTQAIGDVVGDAARARRQRIADFGASSGRRVLDSRAEPRAVQCVRQRRRLDPVTAGRAS